MDNRRASLLAAAAAVRSWVHARRATWSDEPIDIGAKRFEPRASVPQTNAALPQLAAPQQIHNLPYAVEPPSSPPPVAVVAAPPIQMAPPIKTPPPTQTAPRLGKQVTPWARSVATLLVRWSLRAAAAGALAVGLLMAAGTTRTYWQKLTVPARTYWQNLTAPKSGTVVFDSAPAGSQVTVDDTIMGTTPLTAKLTPGRHVVAFRYRNATRTMEIDVAADTSTQQHVDWRRKATGRLQVNSDPAGARVVVDGQARGVTPLTVDDLSIGSHDVVLQTAKGSLRRTVTVAADRTALLTEAIYPGWLKVFSPIELEITEGTRAIHLDDRNQVLLSPGSHELRLQNRALGYHEVRSVELKPGETTSISLIPPPSTIAVTATLPSEVSIDGERVGETPLTNQPINLGTRDVTVRSAAGDERRFTITVTVKPVELDVDFSKSPR